MTIIKKLDTPIFQLTVGEFLAIIRREQDTPKVENPQVPEIFGVKVLKELTGYSLASIYAKTSKNEISHFKRDGKLFFQKDDILKWLTENPVVTRKQRCDELDANLAKRRR